MLFLNYHYVVVTDTQCEFNPHSQFFVIRLSKTQLICGFEKELLLLLSSLVVLLRCSCAFCRVIQCKCWCLEMMFPSSLHGLHLTEILLFLTQQWFEEWAPPPLPPELGCVTSFVINRWSGAENFPSLSNNPQPMIKDDVGAPHFKRRLLKTTKRGCELVCDRLFVWRVPNIIKLWVNCSRVVQTECSNLFFCNCG